MSLLIQKLKQGPLSLVRKINELVEAANAFKGLSGDGLIKVRHTIGGATIQLDTKAVEARIPKRGRGGGGGARRAFVKTTPLAVETVVCWLSDIDDEGEEVIVSCDVVGGSALNSAWPRLADGEPILVQFVSGNWRCTNLFQTICNA